MLEYTFGAWSEDKVNTIIERIGNLDDRESLITKTLFNHTSNTIRIFNEIQKRNGEKDAHILIRNIISKKKIIDGNEVEFNKNCNEISMDV